MKCLKLFCRINEKLEPLFWLITLNGLVNPLVYLGKIDTTVAKKIICNQGKVAKEFKSSKEHISVDRGVALSTSGDRQTIVQFCIA